MPKSMFTMDPIYPLPQCYSSSKGRVFQTYAQKPALGSTSSVEKKEEHLPCIYGPRQTFIDGRLKWVPRRPLRQRTGELDMDIVQHQWGVQKIQAFRAPVKCSPKRINELGSVVPGRRRNPVLSSATWLTQRFWGQDSGQPTPPTPW